MTSRAGSDAATLLDSMKTTTEAGDPEGVILLHGLLRTSASMRPLETFLTKRGYLVVNHDYPSRTAPIKELAEAAIPAALGDARLAACRKIHFVTHSLGGILVRSYFAERADPRLGRVVMLGPPNQGSEVVDRLGGGKWFARLHGPAGGELGTRPDSTPCRLGVVPFELGVIAGDRSINWINSLMIAGPDDGKVSVERTKVAGMKAHVVVHATHPLMMRQRRVQELVLAFLRTGEFSVS